MNERAGDDRVLVLWCPDWPVEAFGSQDDTPLVVLENERVLACSERARQAGVRRGARKREAQSCCPEATVVQRDLSKEARAFEPVVCGLEAMAPGVEMIRPGTCAVKTRGPSRYFGGDSEFALRVEQMATDLGVVSRSGIADGMFVATLAARESTIVEPGKTAEFVAPMHVACLGDRDLASILVRLGIHTLGAFAALHTTDVAARFGPTGTTAHMLASGRNPRPLVDRKVQEQFVATAVVDPPAEQAERVAFAAKNAAHDLIRQCSSSGFVCRCITIEIETDHGETRHRTWSCDVAFDAAHLVERLRWQLDGWLSSTEPTAPTAGVSTVRFLPVEMVIDNGRQPALWGGESAADKRAVRSIARVQGLLGHSAVFAAVEKGGRMPGDWFRLVDWDSRDRVERDVDPSAPWPGRLPPPAPSLIHRPGINTDVLDATGAKVLVSRRGTMSARPEMLRTRTNGAWDRIDRWAGPWLFEERWWDANSITRQACFQFSTFSGSAFLMSFRQGEWSLEATYD